jgi:hypothetical protein
MEDQKPIALWAVPRSISTAFERVFVERDDFEVFHEPFSASYYYSEERRSDRYKDEPPRPEYNYGRVLEEILRPRERRVFVKDMAYHVRGFMDEEFVSHFQNTFIVREPKYVISSLRKMWPDFTLEETGYEQAYRLFRLVERTGESPVVVDAMSFSEDPEGILAAYCERVGVPFDPGALSWQPSEVPEWERWEEWHERAQNSTGIDPVERRDPELPSGLQEVYEHCLPYYYRLAANVIRSAA